MGKLTTLKAWRLIEKRTAINILAIMSMCVSIQEAQSKIKDYYAIVEVAEIKPKWKEDAIKCKSKKRRY